MFDTNVSEKMEPFHESSVSKQQSEELIIWIWKIKVKQNNATAETICIVVITAR